MVAASRMYVSLADAGTSSPIRFHSFVRSFVRKNLSMSSKMFIFSAWKINHQAIFYCHTIVFLTTKHSLFPRHMHIHNNLYNIYFHEMAKPKNLRSKPTAPININVFGNFECVRMHFINVHISKRITKCSHL